MTQEAPGSLGQALDSSGSVSLVQCRVLTTVLHPDCLQPLLLLHSLLPPPQIGFGRNKLRERPGHRSLQQVPLWLGGRTEAVELQPVASHYDLEAVDPHTFPKERRTPTKPETPAWQF